MKPSEKSYQILKKHQVNVVYIVYNKELNLVRMMVENNWTNINKVKVSVWKAVLKAMLEKRNWTKVHLIFVAGVLRSFFGDLYLSLNINGSNNNSFTKFH